MSVWDDTQIRAGDKWRSEIDRAIAGARAAVLLVTPDFLESDFIAEHELPPLLEAASRGGKRILWIPLSASSYRRTEIRHYQALSDPARPLDGLSHAEQNQALVDIANRIAEALED
jgi:internalin A